jgi:hypothetical protein
MRPLSSTTSTNAAALVTRPVFIVEIDLPTTVRYCSRETLTYAGNTWTKAPLQVDLASSTVSLFNTDGGLTSTFNAGASGAPVFVWMLYGDGTFADGSAEMVLAGEIGAISISSVIALRVRPTSQRYVPRLYCTPPTFNWLPPAGFEIRTASGVFVLEQSP